MLIRKKLIRGVVLFAFVMNMPPVIGDSLAARMDKQQSAGWTITRVYDEKGHFAGATISDEKGQKVYQCNDELCVARGIQQRRLQLITDHNMPEGERRAFTVSRHQGQRQIRFSGPVSDSSRRERLDTVTSVPSSSAIPATGPDFSTHLPAGTQKRLPCSKSKRLC